MADSPIYYDAFTGVTHLLEITGGSDGRDRYWFHCAPPLGRVESDEVHAGDEAAWPNIMLRGAADAFITCLWCVCGRRRS